MADNNLENGKIPVADREFDDPTGETALEVKGVNKSFSGVQVLFNVDFEIKYGEVHALMGENGAGKSTLIKIITGVYRKDTGDIYRRGNLVDITSRQDARDAGIAVIYQELSLVPDLTVMENIYLGQELSKRGIRSKKEMRKKCLDLMARYDLDLNPNAIVDSLSMAQRQMVEILKALSMDAKLLIMDEPTSSLSASEAEKLFGTIDGLRKRGTGILYVSHRLDEVYRLSDRLTVMRDGNVVGVLSKEEINPKTVTTMMIGREIKQTERVLNKRNEDIVLEVEDLYFGTDLLKGINFKAYGGEILGIGGLVGSGRTELIHCIYGAKKPKSGTITLNGKPISNSIRRNIEIGFGLVPEDRRIEGFNPLQSIERNLAICSYDVLANYGLVNKKKEREWAEKAIVDYDIRPKNRKMLVENLSGGNQQKVILGRWLSRDLKVLLLDEPTVGVDVGVKAELYRLMKVFAEKGVIIIMVSSDLAELRHVSDRILVMHGGKFFEEFSGDNVTQSAILLAASGEHTEEGVAL